MRVATTLLVTAGLVASLAACSTPAPDTATGDCDTTPSGAASDSVEVLGDFGTAPEINFDFPLTAEATQRTVAIEGDGDQVVDGDTVNVQYTIVNATTGEGIAATDYTEATLAAFPVDGTFIPGITNTLQCSTVGSRVVGVIPPVDAFGDTGSTDLGVAAGDSLIFVADVVSIEEPVAPATPGEWTKDVPEVSFDDAGLPTVTLPDTAPPTELLLKVLEEGDGAEVAAGDTVTINYQGTSWDTGEVFDQSYGGEPATFSTNGVIEGFAAALVGQKVGSTVLVVMPPEYAYGTDPAQHELGGQTLVFLIEIQAATAG